MIYIYIYFLRFDATDDKRLKLLDMELQLSERRLQQEEEYHETRMETERLKQNLLRKQLDSFGQPNYYNL